GKLHTFSALYPGETIDESEYISEVEQHAHSLPHYCYPNVDAFWDEIMTWVWFQEEPTIATAPYAYWCMYHTPSERVKVVLSGNGGDELLAGYIPYFRSYLTAAVDQRRWLEAARETWRGRDLYWKYGKQLVRERAPGTAKAPPVRSMLSGEHVDLR